MSNNLDEGQKLVSMVTEASLKLQQVAPPYLKAQVQSESDNVKPRWEQLKANVGQCSTDLHIQLQCRSEFEDLYQSLLEWLSSMEAQLISEPDAKLELVEKKAQLDKCKV